MNKRSGNLRKITVTAIMSAMGFVLMMVGDSIPVPLMPSFIKLDLSELPALITAFAFGPFWGVLVCLVKNLVHLAFFFSNSFGIGELTNFLLGVPFVAVAGAVYKVKHNRKSAFAGALIGDFAMAAMCFVVNLFIAYPIYIKAQIVPEAGILGMYQAVLPSVNALWQGVLIFNVPFTFIKGLISVVITFVIYHKLSPIIKGKVRG